MQKYTRKQIGIILDIVYRKVEKHIARIYRKIYIHSSQQLKEYC
ncbi:LuxR C-terminal-related transcriptional regulator [Photorhabdus sp. APURE]|nr:LuxR C-terminal-related transcriptional regulator [Photorhabdus aballayi]MCW7550662.1 LuxR C-terminal-related transcriptional regulator [Photorhabdus aballayi]